MQILITGSAGYVGSLLTRFLVDKGHFVVGIDNFWSKSSMKPLNIENNFKFFNNDICDLHALTKICGLNDIEYIVHLAAITGETNCRKNPRLASNVNILGTLNLLEVSKQFDLKRFILASSAAVYGTPQKNPITELEEVKPLNFYGTTKLTAEHLVHIFKLDYGLRSIILRFSNIYGLGEFIKWNTVVSKFIKQTLNNLPMTVFGDGMQERDFVHLKDIIRGIECALITEKDFKGETFNLGGNCNVSILELAKRMKNIFLDYNIEAKHIFIPSPRIETFTKNFSFSTEKAQKDFDFEPKIKLDDGIREIIDYGIRTRISELDLELKSFE